MFKITEGDFKNQTYGDESYLSNWPMLYILENGKQAYIGESNHVKNRMSQHHSSVDKRIFDKVHFIYSSRFNQSVTFDYESKLIQYIVADELYEVRNKNAGMADKEYYGKKEYDEKFQVLWRSLQREKLVKHSLEELENSDLFKYSPFKELNNDQRTAVEEIVDSLKQEENQTVVVNGMPGSGKTIVAIFLLKYLRDSEEFKDKKINDIKENQQLLLDELNIIKSKSGLKETDFILDGHLCLLNKSNKNEKIPLNILKRFGIDNIIVIVDSVRNIKYILKELDNIDWSNEFIELFQNKEIKYARELAKEIGADLRIIKNHIDGDMNEEQFDKNIILPIKPEYADKILSGQ